MVHYLIGAKYDRLEHTGYMVLVVDPTDYLALDIFAAVNFSWLWGCEDDQDLSCVNRCYGFVITLGGTPVLWVSKIHIDISVSTTEVEYISLSHYMIELLHLSWLI